MVLYVSFAHEPSHVLTLQDFVFSFFFNYSSVLISLSWAICGLIQMFSENRKSSRREKKKPKKCWNQNWTRFQNRERLIFKNVHSMMLIWSIAKLIKLTTRKNVKPPHTHTNTFLHAYIGFRNTKWIIA